MAYLSTLSSLGSSGHHCSLSNMHESISPRVNQFSYINSTNRACVHSHKEILLSGYHYFGVDTLSPTLPEFFLTKIYFSLHKNDLHILFYVFGIFFGRGMQPISCNTQYHTFNLLTTCITHQSWRHCFILPCYFVKKCSMRYSNIRMTE